MLFQKKSTPTAHWDPETQTPAIRCSICTGEQVAGFIRREDGSFVGVQLIQSPKDLQDFREMYGLGDQAIRKIY